MSGAGVKGEEVRKGEESAAAEGGDWPSERRGRGEIGRRVTVEKRGEGSRSNRDIIELVGSSAGGIGIIFE